MLTTILLWLLLGAIAGFLVAFALGTNERMGFINNIFVGVVGAVAGGLVLRMAGPRLTFSYASVSLITAGIGALLLLAAVRATRDTME